MGVSLEAEAMGGPVLGWSGSLGLLNLIWILHPWRLIWHWAGWRIWVCDSYPGVGPDQEPWFVVAHPVSGFAEARITVLTMGIKIKKHYWTNWFFLVQQFSLEFSKTENNKELKPCILPPLTFRDDVFDSLLSTCTTYAEESFMSCRVYHSLIQF